ncbi:MAG: hypothetical protein V4719_24255 [Planctomycetota bacterium]
MVIEEGFFAMETDGTGPHLLAFSNNTSLFLEALVTRSALNEGVE